MGVLRRAPEDSAVSHDLSMTQIDLLVGAKSMELKMTCPCNVLENMATNEEIIPRKLLPFFDSAGHYKRTESHSFAFSAC